MGKMKCIDTIQCPSLLIENEKSAVDKVLHIYRLNVGTSHNSAWPNHSLKNWEKITLRRTQIQNLTPDRGRLLMQLGGKLAPNSTSSILEVWSHEMFKTLEQQGNLKIACDLWIWNVTKRRRETPMCHRKQYKNSKSDAETNVNYKGPRWGRKFPCR